MSNVSLHLVAIGRGQKTIRYELCLATLAPRPQRGRQGLPARFADWAVEQSGTNNVSQHSSGMPEVARVHWRPPVGRILSPYEHF